MSVNNEKIIWDYFRKKGLNEYGVAGLMGNLKAESNLNPKNLQQTYERKLKMTDASYTKAVDDGSYTNFVKDSAGYGLAQWTYWSRKENLLEFAIQQNKSIGDLQMQLDFLYKELTKSYAHVWRVLLNATSVLEASNVVLLKYERPANQGESAQKKRAGYGQAYYDKYATGASKEEPKEEDKKPVEEETKFYRVQVGAYRNLVNAKKMQKKVIADNFPCIIKESKGYYKCQVGAYTVKSNAQSMLKKVQAAGYEDAYITFC